MRPSALFLSLSLSLSLLSRLSPAQRFRPSSSHDGSLPVFCYLLGCSRMCALRCAAPHSILRRRPALSSGRRFSSRPAHGTRRVWRVLQPSQDGWSRASPSPGGLFRSRRSRHSSFERDMAQRNTAANGKIVRRTERTYGASSRRRIMTTTTTDGDGASPSSSACIASRCISQIIARSHPFLPFPRRGCNRCGFTYSRRTLRDFSLLLCPGIRRSFSFEVARFLRACSCCCCCCC